MTGEQLQELRRLEQAATVDGWWLEKWGDGSITIREPEHDGTVAVMGESVHMVPGGEMEANAELIVKSRNALPDLLGEVERLRSRVRELESVCRHAYEFVDYVVENNATIIPSEGEALRRLSIVVDTMNPKEITDDANE